jgi:hypothetical protein
MIYECRGPPQPLVARPRATQGRGPLSRQTEPGSGRAAAAAPPTVGLLNASAARARARMLPPWGIHNGRCSDDSESLPGHVKFPGRRPGRRRRGGRARGSVGLRLSRAGRLGRRTIQ